MPVDKGFHFRYRSPMRKVRPKSSFRQTSSGSWPSASARAMRGTSSPWRVCWSARSANLGSVTGGMLARPATGYQTSARSPFRSAIGAPSGTPNAAANAGVFESGPFTRYCDGEWVSTLASIRAAASV